MGLDRSALERLRQMILADGARQLTVGDLCDDDLGGLAWSGDPAHLRSVAAVLQRAVQGLEDYLVVRAPGGQPVAKMRVDHTSEAGAASSRSWPGAARKPPLRRPRTASSPDPSSPGSARRRRRRR